MDPVTELNNQIHNEMIFELQLLHELDMNENELLKDAKSRYMSLSKEWAGKYIIRNTSCHLCESECFIRIDGFILTHVCTMCGKHNIQFYEVPDKYIQYDKIKEWIESMQMGYLKYSLRVL